MRRIAVLALVSSTLVAASAEAAVTKYRLRSINLSQGEASSPPSLAVGAGAPPTAPFDTSFVDASGAEPVLVKFVFKSLGTITVDVPGFAGPGSFIFLSNNFNEGTGPLRKPHEFTGTGSTADGSTVVWGIVTGWTVTGSQYCKSAPPVICAFAGQVSETTGEPLWMSDFYDMGTWTFHGTGFTATPFVHQYFTTSFGNNSRWVRGFSLVDATVPALPLLGVGLLGGSLVLGAVAVLRRSRGR